MDFSSNMWCANWCAQTLLLIIRLFAIFDRNLSKIAALPGDGNGISLMILKGQSILKKVETLSKSTVKTSTQYLLYCALASRGAVYCNVIGHVCEFVRVFVCGCDYGSVTTITRNCVIDPHQTGSVGKGSDRLQLVIKFCPFHAPVKRVCGAATIFGSSLIEPVFASL